MTTSTETAITLCRTPLYHALKTVIGVVESAQILQILSFVKLEFNGSTLTLTATDTSIELRTTCQAQTLNTQSSFVATLPGKKLLDICKNLPDDSELTLAQKKDWMIISTSSSQFTLATLPHDSFPASHPINSHCSVTLEESQLVDLFQRTSFAMAHQDVRHYLNGVHLKVTPDSLQTTATNGHRLAIYPIAATTGISDAAEVILPKKTVQELMRLLDMQSDTSLQIHFSEQQIIFEHPHFTLTSHLLLGNYPNCHALIPQNPPFIATVDRLSLKQALQRAAIISLDKFKSARFVFSHNHLAIHALNNEKEKTDETVSMTYNGEDLTMAFNIQYVLDVLNILDGDTVTLALTDPKSCILMTDHTLPKLEV